MANEVSLYDGYYGELTTDVQRDVRRETYGEDLGQSSWISGDEAREACALLSLGSGRRLLEVACGSGGVTCAIAKHSGATCTGVDINVYGIAAAKSYAEREGLSSLVSFQMADASQHLPFADGSFDAIFCNDAINHLPDRRAVMRDWHRLLRPGGRVLFTDPVVVTGQLSNEEIRERSSIGPFIFTLVGHNERLLTDAGFDLRWVSDATEATASISGRWFDARAKRRERLTVVEGEDTFEGVQRFLKAVYVLSSERRLSRFRYCARKRA